MSGTPGALQRYTNPLIDHDVPDPDAIALTTGSYALVASSFNRSPGLPLWHSADLMRWTPVGFAGGYRPDAPEEAGVWAPSIREHDGRIVIVWGDPDEGIFVTEAPALSGPWSTPRLLRAGRGLIDPCPHWDSAGRAWIVHGYARSRVGFANRLDVFEVDAELTRPLGPSRPLIDGDAIPDCTVLEGPKVYERDGFLWIFAPAGGVATGWQYVFRARAWDGPWERRIVLAQGDTDINGPHQGAWLPGTDGEDWFLHFQATGVRGRVLHLQPLRWGADGWPVLGDPARPGVPVHSWPTPSGGTVSPPPPPAGDDFNTAELSPAWHGRGAERDALVAAVGDGALTLHGHPDGAILRPLDGGHTAITVTVTGAAGAGAALLISDAVQCELVVHLPPEGAGTAELVTVGPAGRHTVRLGQPVAVGTVLGIEFRSGEARFTLDGVPVGEALALQGRLWTGAEWGLAARGAGTATFGPVTVS